MTDTRDLGEVIDLDARRDHAPPQPRRPGRTPPAAPDDRGDLDNDAPARVLVDAPPGPEPGRLAAAWQAGQGGQRHPVIPAWMRDRAELRHRVRWLAGHLAHTSAYHAVRVPKYAARMVLRSPRGLVRAAGGVHRWVFDHEALPLRLDAVARNDPEMYVKLLRHRDDRVRWRAILTVAGMVGVALLAAVIATRAGTLGRAAAAAAVVALLGWLGSPADRPLLDTAVVAPRVARLTSAVLIRAFASLGIAEINRAVAKGGDGITFPAPITRDGPGWRADIELPHGVTAVDILDRRDRLASGLRRPLSCVWPEPAGDEEHEGRITVWVGDRPMNKTTPPMWPLAEARRADVFAPVPFGTDARGRTVTVTLMFSSVLVGAMPRVGKTFAIKPLLLASGLDPTVENHVFELKGTGDLGFAEQYAYSYASGAGDVAVAACMAALRKVHADLDRRAQVIAGLPKDACPENKVTPELAARKNLGLRPVGFWIDECQRLFTHPAHGKEAAGLCDDLIRIGPAMGIFLVLATQRPDSNSLPTSISANAGIRFCLRVMGQTENDMVLGTSAYKNGIRATTFTRRDLGIGYLVGEADDPQIIRTYYLSREAAEHIATRARAARIAAGTLSGYAAGQADDDTTAPAVSILDDLLAVTTSAEDKVRSQVVVDRLAQLRPETYGPWGDLEPGAKATQLADALKPYGIETVQVNRRAGGRQVNQRGVIRAHVITVRDKLRGPGGGG